MKNAPKIRVQRAVLAGAAVLALMGVTGCSAANEQATTRHYSASDGVHATVGPVELRNVLLISGGSAEEARMLGAVFNNSSSAVQVTLEGDSGASAQVTVPANGMVSLEDDENEALFATTGAEPGAQAPITVEVNSESAEIQAPVLNGSLPEYREYLPGGFDEKSIEHLTPSEAAEEH